MSLGLRVVSLDGGISGLRVVYFEGINLKRLWLGLVAADLGRNSILAGLVGLDGGVVGPDLRHHFFDLAFLRLNTCVLVRALRLMRVLMHFISLGRIASEVRALASRPGEEEIVGHGEVEGILGAQRGLLLPGRYVG